MVRIPNKKWYEGFLTPQTAIMILVGFASVVTFYNDVNLIRSKIKVIENKAEITDIKALDEKVTRQYSVQREMNDKTNKEVDELKLWMEYQKGYEQAKKDYKFKN